MQLKMSAVAASFSYAVSHNIAVCAIQMDRGIAVIIECEGADSFEKSI